MVAFSIEHYREHIIVKNIDVEAKTSGWLFDRLIAFPGTKYNKEERSWVISKCYQHLVEIVIATYLNKISRKEWLAEYKADTGVKEMSGNEERALLKEHFTPLCAEEWNEYLLDYLPMGSSWRRIVEGERT